MSKLFNLKEWLTLDEAAQHLTGVLGEPVERRDIHRLSLDGHLQLSVNFVNPARARLGTIVRKEQAEGREVPDNISRQTLEDPVEALISLKINEYNYINLDSDIITIDGIWDLMTFVGETQDSEHYFQQLTDGPSIAITMIDTIFVKHGNQVVQLQERMDSNEYHRRTNNNKNSMEAMFIHFDISSEIAKKIREEFQLVIKAYEAHKKASRDKEFFYYPADALPTDSELVVKTSAIMEFLNLLDVKKSPVEKTLSTKERQSLLVLIAALCKEAGIDYTQRGIATSIEKMTEELGAPITDDTIRKILKQIEDAVTARSK